MKTKAFIIFIIFIAFFLSSCESEKAIMNYDSEKHLELYDYSTISVDYEYTQITDEDIKNIIETELSVNEVYVKTEKINVENEDIVLISIDGVDEYYFIGSNAYSDNFEKELMNMSVGETKEIAVGNYGKHEICLINIYRIASIDDTDFILKYYKCSTLEELRTFIRERATEEIIFNYAYDLIYEKSVLFNFPNEIQKQIDSDIKKCRQQILQQYSDFNEFLIDNEMTNDEFVDSISSNYYELMLYKAILDKENTSVTKLEIKDYKTKNKTNEYSDYDIFRELAYQQVRKILISKTQIIDKTESIQTYNNVA